MLWYYGGNDGRGSGAGAVPFAYDANTYWWDFDGPSILTDALGDDTVSFVPERIRGEANAVQILKDYQALKVAGEGVTFAQGSNRHYVIEDIDGITNGTDGWFFCANVKMTSADGYIFCINAAGSSANSRARIYFTAGRQPAFRANVTDSATLNVVAQGQAMVLDTWYTLGILFDLAADTAKIYINGVEQTLTSGPSGGPWDNFPATDPSNILIGNGTVSAVDSFDGTIGEIILYSGVPSTVIQDSITEYVGSQRFDIPDAPVIIGVTGNTQIGISFTEPDDHNVAITDYEYQYKLHTEPTTWTDFSDGTSATPGTTVTGITNDLKYDVRARAVNALGNSAWSNTVTVTPTANPGPPEAPVVTALTSNQRVRFFFSEPLSNGYDITDYKLYRRPTGSGSYSEVSTPVSSSVNIEITGVTNGTAYEYYVTAINSQGESDPSNILDLTTTAPPDMSSIVASCLCDIDFRNYDSYAGTGDTLTNLVVSTGTAYDFVKGDGVTSSKKPTFIGTPGDPAATMRFDGNDYLTIKNGNTQILKDLHKTTGGQPFWIVLVGKFVDGASSQYFYSTKTNSTTPGLAGYCNSAEAMRFEQRGDSSVLTASGSATLNTTDRCVVAFSHTQNGGTVRIWMGSTTKQQITRSFNTGTTDAVEPFKIGCQSNASGEFANLTEIDAFCFGNEYIDDAQITAILAEYATRHGGVDYTP